MFFMAVAKNSRPDFVKWVVNMLRDGKQIKIVTDQIKQSNIY
jgi:dTDP-4-dehydrorhamnose reductase